MRGLFGSVGSVGLVMAAVASAAPVAPRRVLDAQAPAVSQTAANWTVARDPFMDLWFHCLAVIGYDGYGSLNLYNNRYADRVKDAKARTRITTTLDRRAVELRRSLAADSAFEVLHFLPLYFVGKDPSVVLPALRAALDNASRETYAGSVASTGALIAAALPTARERAVLISLIDAANDEWTSFVRNDRMKQAANDRQAVVALQAAWNDRFVAPLSGYLAATNVKRGTIFISPAIGGEGRIVRGPGGAVIVAVGSRVGAPDTEPLLAAVRELSFPLLDQLRAPLVGHATRVAAAKARDAAAVRAGALVLDAIDPSLAADYRRLFVALIGGGTLEEAYPLDRAAEVELRHLVTSAMHGAASPGTSYENQ